MKTSKPIRFNLVSAVHLLLARDGKILLLRRFNTGYQDGNYSVVAGHLDGGESARLAMAREAREESGIIIDPEHLEVVHVMHRGVKEDPINGNERIDFFLTAKVWTGEPTILEPDKCDELRWFPVAQLPDNMVPYVRFGIQNYQNNILYSEFGW